jgi:hypothetical protein
VRSGSGYRSHLTAGLGYSYDLIQFSDDDLEALGIDPVVLLCGLIAPDRSPLLVADAITILERVKKRF